MLVIQIRFLFTWPRTLLLIQIKSEFSRLPIYFNYRTSIINKLNDIGLLKSYYSNYCFDSLFIMETIPTLPLAIKWATWWPLPQGIQIPPLHLRDSTLVAAIPTLISDLRRGASTEHFKDAETPHLPIQLFLTVVVKGAFSRSSQGWSLPLWCTKAGLAFQLHLA